MKKRKTERLHTIPLGPVKSMLSLEIDRKRFSTILSGCYTNILAAPAAKLPRPLSQIHWRFCLMRTRADEYFFDYSLAPYERRVIELLRNSKDKRARKLAKKRVC